MNTGMKALLVLVVLAAGAAGIYVATEDQRLSREGKAFVDQAIPQITREWKLETTMPYFDRLKLASVGVKKPAILMMLVHYQQRLGPIKKYDGAQGSAKTTRTGDKKSITAEYSASGEFERGTATIELGLNKDTGEWKIDHFHVKVAGDPPPPPHATHNRQRP